MGTQYRFFWQQIYKSMDLKDTQELLEIWKQMIGMNGQTRHLM